MDPKTGYAFPHPQSYAVSYENTYLYTTNQSYAYLVHPIYKNHNLESKKKLQKKTCPSSKILKILIVFMYHLIRISVSLPIVLGIRIETLRVSGISYRRNNRPRVSTVDDVVPVDGLEEWVVFYTARAAADVAETAGAVDGAEGADYVFGLVGYGRVLGECYWLFDDSLE